MTSTDPHLDDSLQCRFDGEMEGAIRAAATEAGIQLVFVDSMTDAADARYEQLVSVTVRRYVSHDDFSDWANERTRLGIELANLFARVK